MEDKKFIIGLIRKHRDDFVHFVDQQSEQSFTKTVQDKWSVGQNLDHLIRSLTPVNQALLLPSVVLRLLFGKPNRPARDYSRLRERYHQKLSAGGTAAGRFIPPIVSWEKKEKKVADFKLQTDRMIKRIDSWNENQLDQFLLPHPLLGKITLREMLFFSAYHIQHHLLLLESREIES